MNKIKIEKLIKKSKRGSTYEHQLAFRKRSITTIVLFTSYHYTSIYYSEGERERETLRDRERKRNIIIIKIKYITERNKKREREILFASFIITFYDSN